MRCSRARRLVSDHVDHLLDGDRVRKLESHLRQCPRCRELLASMQSIASEAKQLKMAPPSEDLWPAIREKVEQAHKKAAGSRRTERKPFLGFSPFPVRLAYGVSAVLAAVLVFSLVYYWFPYVRNENNDLTRNESDQLQSAGRELQTAIAALDKTISDRKTRLSPDLETVFKTNLAILDNSIRDCRAAVESNREDRVANLHLLICYRKKMELLNDIKNMAMQTG